MGPLRYDLERGELKRGDTVIRLTQTEATIMRFFCERPGEVIRREALVDHLGRDRAGHSAVVGQDRAVDVQITRLRRKIEHDPKTPVTCKLSGGPGICWSRIDCADRAGHDVPGAALPRRGRAKAGFLSPPKAGKAAQNQTEAENRVQPVHHQQT